MATYYVDGTSGSDSNNGATGTPWKTLGKAYNSSSANDTIIVRTAVYYEDLTLAKNGQTWQADTGNTPRLDGRYGPNYQTYNMQSNQLPGGQINKQYAAMVSITGDGVTWDGIDIKHIAGQGLVTTTSSNNATIKNCDIHYCYSASINLQGDNATVDNVDMRYASLKKRATAGDGYGNTQTACMVKGSGNTIQNSTLKYVYAEGISLDKRSSDGSVLNCRLEDTAHGALYINDHIRPTLDGNIVIQTDLYPEWAGKNPSVGILLRDECEGGPTIHQERQVITNNILIGCGEALICTSNRDSCNEGVRGSLTRLDNGYIAFNTIVNPIFRAVRFDERSALPYKSSIFENNLIVITKGNAEFGKGTVSPGGIAFRNNVWYHYNGGQPDAKFRGTGDSYTNPRLSNPGVKLAPDLSANNYKLTGSSSNAIGGASNGSRTNNLTPPTVAEDYFGASRPSGTNRDIGAHEFGGTVSDTITASFTMDDNSGVAPHTVTFTDTSTTDSGTVDAWLWEFGDGATSTTQSPVHTYAEPGIYTVRLQATNTAGLVDTATGTVTVSQENVEGSAASSFHVGAYALNTSTGDQDITLSLDGQTPRGLLFFVTAATADNTNANGLLYSVGSWSAEDTPRSNCAAIRVNDNTATAEQYRYSVAAPGAEVIATLDSSGDLDGRAYVQSVAPDKVTLNIDDAFPSAYRVVIMAFAGSGVRAASRTMGSTLEGVSTQLEYGFRPDFVFAFSNFSSNNIGEQPGAEMSLGLADSIDNQHCVYWGQDNAIGDGLNRGSYKSGMVAQARYAQSDTDRLAMRWKIVDWTNTSIYVEQSHTAQRPLHTFAVYLGGAAAEVKAIDSPTNTSATPYAITDTTTPAGLLMLLSGVTVDGHQSDAAGPGTWGVYATDGATDYSAVAANENGAATINTATRVSDSLVLLDDDGTTETAGAASVGTEGQFSVTLTTAPAAAQKWIALALEEGASVSGPTAAFAATPTAVEAGDTVTFTDLSNGNGETITEWFWQFGDDETSESQNPTHTYSAEGTYTVSLTVTNVAGSSTSTRTNYITVGAGGEPPTPPPSGGASYIQGPFDPVTITNSTTNVLGTDPESDMAGLHSHRLDLETLQIDSTPELPLPTVPGKIVFGFDSSGNLQLKRDDAYTATVNLTWTAPQYPVPSFTISDTTPNVDQSLTFTDTSTNSPTSWYWNFGDGGESYLQNPTHTYTSAGFYFVGMTATNIHGSAIAGWGLNVTEALAGGTENLTNGSYAYEDTNDSTANTTQSPIILSAGGRWAAFRFDPVDIPQGATIDSATFRITCTTATRDDPDLVIYAEDTSDSAAFTGTFPDISARTLTDNSVAWDATGVGAAEVTAPSITTLIQEVINRPGWVSGNALTIIFDSLAASDFSITGTSAELDITWS